MNFYIYDKWILTKYPKAAKYSHNGLRYVGKKLFDPLRIKFLTVFVINKILRKIKLKNFTNNKITSNTPIEYWYNTKVEIKEELDKYFNSNIYRLNNYPELRDDCTFLYKTGTSMEKNQVLTLLGVIKKYFS